MALSERSLKNLEGVHEDLVKVVKRADELTDVEFIVTEGVRSLARQRKLVASGASQTLKSRHITGHAIDFVPIIEGEPSWAWPPFYIIAEAFKKAAKELGVSIVWGGDWKSFKDGPHIELDRKVYP